MLAHESPFPRVSEMSVRLEKDNSRRKISKHRDSTQLSFDEEQQHINDREDLLNVQEDEKEMH